MRHPISAKVHGILDYATIGFALTFPRLFRSQSRTCQAVTALALGKLGYTLLTRHELGLIKLLPMKAHLVLDAIGGAGLCVLPAALGEDDPATIAACVGMGLFDIAAAPLTQTQSPLDRAGAQGQRRPVISAQPPPPGELPSITVRDTGAHATAPL